jgi:signal transduction histidine kinase
LIVSAVEAYRIQSSVSKQQLEIYRHYVEQDKCVVVLRKNLWLAGNYVRDFFIRNTPAQAEVLRDQLQSLEAEDEEYLDRLSRLSSPGDVMQQVRKSLNEFWAVVDPLPKSMLGASDDRQWDFLQREIVPRRGELYKTLMDLSASDQHRLQVSEKDFADARAQAAQRLMVMLAISLLLAALVARQSLRHAENLEHRAEKHLADVEQAKQELQQLSARLLEIEEEGKRRLSRELHDEIGQTLALLQIEISQLQSLTVGQPEAIHNRLKRAREFAQKTVQTIRDISGLLRPALLDDLGLVPALQFQLEEFIRRSGISCEFVEENVAEQLPDQLKTCVYRVVQEALHNCEKHAHATSIRVAIRQYPETLSVQIEDNGRGFDVNAQRAGPRPSGLGLLGMRERVSIAGGSLVIESSPGRGARISIQIPLPAMPAPKISHEEVTA